MGSRLLSCLFLFAPSLGHRIKVARWCPFSHEQNIVLVTEVSHKFWEATWDASPCHLILPDLLMATPNDNLRIKVLCSTFSYHYPSYSVFFLLQVIKQY